jgi:hypothetical protein
VNRRPARVALASLLLAAGGALVANAQPSAWPTPLPRSTPAPQPTQVWLGAPASAFALTVEPLGVTPDGEARALVRVALRDAGGAPTLLRRGGDFTFRVDRGSVQWQTRLRYGGPAAVVATRDPGPVAIRVVANQPPELGAARARFTPGTTPVVVAGALGPHLVRLGWFPRLRRGSVRIERVVGGTAEVTAAVVRAPVSSWDDGAVTPGRAARYVVVLPSGRHVVRTAVPPELPAADAQVLRGTAAWLAFSGDPLDDERYTALDVDQIVATAVRARLRVVELRLAYGAFAETTADAQPTIDALIDGLTTHGIRVVGWTVPRTPAADDLAEATAVAAFRTPAGNGLSGLAVDLERGEEFLGEGPRGAAALAGYLATLRRAVGPHVLLVATVEDPFLEHLGPATYPYAAIARAADVLQPMVYWRALGHASGARRAVAGSIEALRRLGGGRPIDVGVQTAAIGPRGAPGPDELAAALAESRARAALGVAFYDWAGTDPAQWAVLAGITVAARPLTGRGVPATERQP